MEARHRLVERMQEAISEKEIAFHSAYWKSQVDSTPENDRQRADLELELRRVKGDPEAFRAVSEALDGVHEDRLRRELEVLRLSLAANQMTEERRTELVELSSAVESDFASFRPEIDGRRLSDNDIEEVLKTSNDESERRAAWEASKEIGRLAAPRIKELARFRNDAARDLGYADYYRMSLDLEELDEGWLFGVMDQLERVTSGPFAVWKTKLDAALAQRFDTTTLYPWHYADAFFQQPPAEGRIDLSEMLSGKPTEDLVLATFEGWGIDLSGVLKASDLYPRERKSQHAFCIDMDRSGEDIRILANVVPGERWVEVMLHESGHAAYDVSVSPRLPYLLHSPAHTFVTEAIALLSGRMVADPAWLVEIAGARASEVESLAGALRQFLAAQLLCFARWGLVMVHFERALYEDPESELDSLWWQLVERYQLVTPPPGRNAPDWAAKIHLAVAPVYYHNYLLGEILASQLREVIERRFGGFVGVAEAGKFLTEEVFRPGSSQRWDKLIAGALGSRLSAQDFAADATAV